MSALAALIKTITHDIHEFFADLHLVGDEDALDDDHLLAKYPGVGGLSDEDIHCIAQGYVSRTDYEGQDMVRVRDALFRLRANSRHTAEPPAVGPAAR